MSNIRQCREEELSTILAIVNGRGAGGNISREVLVANLVANMGAEGSEGTSTARCDSNLLIHTVTSRSSNPSLSKIGRFSAF